MGSMEILDLKRIKMSAVSNCIRHGTLLILPWNIIESFSDGCCLLNLYEGLKPIKFDWKSWTSQEKLLGAFVSLSVGKHKNSLDAAILTIINLRGLTISTVYSGLTS